MSVIPSRTVYDVEITDAFTIANSNFTTLFAGAFMMSGKFYIIPGVHTKSSH